MKNAANSLQLHLADDLEGMKEKYAKKLRKPLVSLVRKLTRRFAKALEKERRDRAKKEARATARLLLARSIKKLAAHAA